MKKKTHQTILTEADKRRIMELKKQGYVHEEIARIM
jgi:transcriptional regulator